GGLDARVRAGELLAHEMHLGHLVLYLPDLAPGATARVPVELVAGAAGTFSSGGTEAYPYYRRSETAFAAPAPLGAGTHVAAALPWGATELDRLVTRSLFATVAQLGTFEWVDEHHVELELAAPRWSDGTPITATDVVASLAAARERVGDPASLPPLVDRRQLA